MVAVIAGAFEEIIAGGFVSGVVAGVFDIVVVSMVTKKGKSCVQCLQTKGLGGQSSETEY